MKEGSLAGRQSQKTQMFCVSVGAVTKVTFAFRSIEKSSRRGVGNCGRKRTLNDHNASALACCVRRNRTVLRGTENVNAGYDQTVRKNSLTRLCVDLSFNLSGNSIYHSLKREQSWEIQAILMPHTIQFQAIADHHKIL